MRFILTLGIASAISILFFIVGILRNESLDYWYLAYNLGLAIVPLPLAFWLRQFLRRYSWADWRVVVFFAVWLFFLPNSFYIVTDFIHLPETQRVDVVQDVVMLTQFSVLGLIFGFMSVYMLHVAVLKYMARKVAAMGAGIVLFLSSFAIYLGRELRWNSWDILANPVGLLRDTSVALVQPEAAWMTASFFLMLASLYAVWWYGLEKAKQ